MVNQKFYVWCGDREQRISYILCLNCQGSESINCYEQIERGKQMALVKENSVNVSMVSELLFITEMKKVNDLMLNRHKDLKDLLTIMDDRLRNIENMLKTPNVLAGTAQKKPENIPVIPTSGKITMDDKTICEIANSVQKENKMNLFLESFRSKYPKGFISEEDCNKASYELWKSQSEGHSNPFWASRSNKAMQAILCKAFVIGKVTTDNGKATNNTTKEKDSDYFIRSFKEVTEDKLSELAQKIEDGVTKGEMVKIGSNVLFDSQSRTYILEYFGKERLDRIYPAEEIKAFLSFLTQFVVNE